MIYKISRQYHVIEMEFDLGQLSDCDIEGSAPNTVVWIRFEFLLVHLNDLEKNHLVLLCL